MNQANFTFKIKHIMMFIENEKGWGRLSGPYIA